MKVIEKKIYTARIGAPFKKEEAQILGEYIEKNHISTPEEMVQYALQEDSPLHNLFEWNKDKAAEQWNLQQGRNIVNHLMVEITYVGGEVELFERGFTYIVDEGEKKFVSIDVGLSNEEYNKQILQNAWATLTGWVERYRQYKEFDKVVKAVEETETILRQMQIV